jgi:hypothetical protein
MFKTLIKNVKKAQNCLTFLIRVLTRVLFLIEEQKLT